MVEVTTSCANHAYIVSFYMLFDLLLVQIFISLNILLCYFFKITEENNKTTKWDNNAILNFSKRTMDALKIRVYIQVEMFSNIYRVIILLIINIFDFRPSFSLCRKRRNAIYLILRAIWLLRILYSFSLVFESE